MKPGTVYLVGAGPGDPGLITVKGAECIRRADVVIYDRLAHPDLLRHARPDAELVYVGKKAAQHTLKQEDINALIVQKALEGKTVCRLKGGDPFVFGRGGEEAEACVDAGVPFEVVPGVTSAIAAPAYAGIPVTHRDASSSFAVITGHEREDNRKLEVGSRQPADERRDWSKIAHAADTLLFLMGVESLSEITGQLLRHGRAPETPVALVRWGTWMLLDRSQQTLVSTLENVVKDVAAARFTAPAVTIVGDVVKWRDTLRWFDTKPLFGKRIVVTRAREQASGLSELLRENGAEPVEFPTIRIAPLEDYTELDAALRTIADCGLRIADLNLGNPKSKIQNPKSYDWAIFTSANGVKSVFERLAVLRTDARAFAGIRVAAIGPATAETLGRNGIRADFVPSRFVAETVVEEWPDHEMSGKRVLLARAREAREFLPDRLRDMGAVVDVVAAYQTVRDADGADAIREQLTTGKIDAVTFTSSSTVRNFVEALGVEELNGSGVAELLSGVTVACIGPITAETAHELGLLPTLVADEFTVDGLAAVLVEHFRRESNSVSR